MDTSEWNTSHDETIFGWVRDTQVDRVLEQLVKPSKADTSVGLKTGKEIAEWLLERAVWDQGLRLSAETRKRLEDLAAERIRLDRRRVPKDRLGLKAGHSRRDKRRVHWKVKRRKKREKQKRKEQSLLARRPWKYFEKLHGKEHWEITEELWDIHIKDCWVHGARITRSDPKLPWTVDNIVITNKDNVVIFDGLQRKLDNLMGQSTAP